MRQAVDGITRGICHSFLACQQRTDQIVCCPKDEAGYGWTNIWEAREHGILPLQWR
jgi:hypothetical protein